MFKHKLALLLLLAGLLCVPASAPATIGFVNSATGNADALGTTIATVAVNHTAGNLLVVGVEWDDAGGGGTLSGLSDTAGNAYTIIPGSMVMNGTTHLQIAYAKNITGNASNVVTATFTAPARFRRIIVHQYSGADTTNPSDVAAVGTGTGTALSTSAVTTNFANEVLVVFGSNNDGVTTTFTAGTNFAIRVPQIANDMGSEDRIVSAKGSYSGAMSTAGSFVWRCSMATFKDATQPPPPPPPPPPGSRFGRGVSGVVAGLCQMIGCECSDPVITSVEYPVNGPVLTGLPVVVKGCGFGDNPDSKVFQVWLTLQDYNQPSNEVDVPLYPVKVRDDTAVVLVPGRNTPKLPLDINYSNLPNPPDPNFPGRPDPNLPMKVRDQTACLQVFRMITRVTSAGPVGRFHASPCFPIGFQALRDIELLRGTDDAVQFLPNESPVDLEEDIYGIAVCIRYAGGASDATFENSCHYPPCFLPPCHSASGTEAYQIGAPDVVPVRLINDWVFTQFVFYNNGCGDTGNCDDLGVSPAPYQSAYPDGATSWKTHISWWVDQNDTAWYKGYLYIEGPCGVPWRPGGPEVLPCM